MATKKQNDEQAHEQTAPVAPDNESSGQEGTHDEAKTSEVQEAAPDSQENVATQAPALESLAVLADRHRVPSWQQAALCRFMGWADGRLASDAEYRDALENLKRRRLCGGRAR